LNIDKSPEEILRISRTYTNKIINNLEAKVGQSIEKLEIVFGDERSDIKNLPLGLLQAHSMKMRIQQVPQSMRVRASELGLKNVINRPEPIVEGITLQLKNTSILKNVLDRQIMTQQLEENARRAFGSLPKQLNVKSFNDFHIKIISGDDVVMDRIRRILQLNEKDVDPIESLRLLDERVRKRLSETNAFITLTGRKDIAIRKRLTIETVTERKAKVARLFEEFIDCVRK